jgi:hypothetical protein
LPLADVISNIFSAGVREVAEGTEAEGNELVVEGVEFAEGWDVEAVAEEGEGAFKRTGAGD